MSWTRFIIAIVLGLLVPLSAFAYLVWDNNRPSAPPTRAAYLAGYERAVQWMLDNQGRNLHDDNVFLWWMIQRAGELRQDDRLVRLAGEYRHKVLDARPRDVWHRLFTPDIAEPVSTLQLDLVQAPDYNYHLLYALTCAASLAYEPVIQQQLREDFCWQTHPLAPACTTHQLIAMQLMARRGCGNAAKVRLLSEALEQRVLGQLFWDPRVVDVYVQRLLVLADSPNPLPIRARWLQRFLEAQLPDGGWGDLQPLIDLGSGRALSFSNRIVGIREVRSSLHTTAQAILLLSLLMK